MNRASILLRPLGLRAEVISTLCLLLAGALLISGLLLLRITERELLHERVMRLIDIAETAVRRAGHHDGNVVAALKALSSDVTLESVVVVDESGRPSGGSDSAVVERSDIHRSIIARANEVRVSYPDFWLPFAGGTERYVRITVPLAAGRGALQARFSLASVRGQVIVAQKLVLATMGAAWLLFVLIGLWLLDRSVIRPIRRLKQATAHVAEGNFVQEVPEKGPVEIADLAAAFNSMSQSLNRSREETAETIDSLVAANEALAKTRQELLRSEKMASVGHFAAGMAHEIGNPLGAAIGYLELLKRESGSGTGKDLCRRTLVELERIDRLVRDLLDYASPKYSSPELLDPSTVASEAVSLLQNQGALDGIRVEIAGNAPAPPVTMERHKLTQVLVNLLLNARDALAGRSGSIALGIRTKDGSVVLSVRDDGEGMDEGISAHIFDPFFTTKGPGRGRGLGLSVCHRIVEEAGGRIEVDSAPGRGTELRVFLPQANAKEQRHDGTFG
jgi:two-component system, NtrC family, sensor kinase